MKEVWGGFKKAWREDSTKFFVWSDLVKMAIFVIIGVALGVQSNVGVLIFVGVVLFRRGYQ